MTHSGEDVREHYEAAIADDDLLLARLTDILDGIEAPITAGKLAALDQFHIGGLTATIELARRATITPRMRVLDAGSGLGGPARWLAESIGCRVTGVDLSPNYVAVARLLTDRSGLADKVDFEVGDLSRLGFDDETFDLVWTQHVAMNIRDRPTLYGELRRVLKPGGTLAFFDPVSGDAGEPFHYPVPWAETDDISALLTGQETKAALEDAGFRVASVEDVTPLAFGWAMEQRQQTAAAPFGLPMIMGPLMGEMVANFARNLQEGRLRLIMGICAAEAGGWREFFSPQNHT